MKQVYYITDSTIFNKDEEMVKALLKGETIVNDDADIKFHINKRNQIEIESFWTGEKAVIKPTNWGVEYVVRIMDDVVGRLRNSKKWTSTQMTLEEAIRK